MTSYPWRCSSAAATAESTPPDIATSTRSAMPPRVKPPPPHTTHTRHRPTPPPPALAPLPLGEGWGGRSIRPPPPAGAGGGEGNPPTGPIPQRPHLPTTPPAPAQTP